MDNTGTDPLAARLAAGDERAFAILYDLYGDRLYRTAVGLLKRREDAEDTVQEVFWAVLRSRQRLANVEDIAAYLFKALRRQVARCNARRAMASASDVEINSVPAPVELLQDRVSPYDDRLQNALMSLSADQREVVILKVQSELSYAQIAEVLGARLSTVSSRYYFALDKLRDALERCHSGED